jgi:hypothetical protein
MAYHDAISSIVRKQPSQYPESAFMRHTLVHGDGTVISQFIATDRSFGFERDQLGAFGDLFAGTEEYLLHRAGTRRENGVFHLHRFEHD